MTNKTQAAIKKALNIKKKKGSSGKATDKASEPATGINQVKKPIPVMDVTSQGNPLTCLDTNANNSTLYSRAFASSSCSKPIISQPTLETPIPIAPKTKATIGTTEDAGVPLPEGNKWSRRPRRQNPNPAGTATEVKKETATAPTIAKDSTSPVLPATSQDNGAIDKYNKPLPSVSASKDKKKVDPKKVEIPTVFQGNGATVKDKKPLPGLNVTPSSEGKKYSGPSNKQQATGSQDNGPKYKDLKPLYALDAVPPSEDKKSPGPSNEQKATGSQDNGPIYMDLTPLYALDTAPSEDKKSSGSSSEQPVTDSQETSTVRKNVNATTQPEAHASSLCKPKNDSSSSSRSSQKSDSSYFTSVESETSTRPPTPDLIPDLPCPRPRVQPQANSTVTRVVATDSTASENPSSARAFTPDLVQSFPHPPPHSYGTATRVITDSARNPIESPKPNASSSSLKVLHSNNQSTIDTESQSSAGSSQGNASTSSGTTYASTLRLPTWTPLEPILQFDVPDIKEILQSSPQHVIVYNRLIKEREKLVDMKEQYRQQFQIYSDRMDGLKRSFLVVKCKLDELLKEHDKYAKPLTPEMKAREENYRNRFYLYGKKSMQTTSDLIVIWKSIGDIDETLINLGEEVHVLQNTFRNRTTEKKTGCLSCFKKIGNFFKSKKNN